MKPILNGMIGMVALLLLVPSVHAFPFTAVVHGPSTLSILEDTSATLTLDINNADFHGHHVRITTHSDNGFVTATPILHDFDMAPYQFTQVGMTLHASEDAEHDLYDVTLTVDMDGQTLDVPLSVYVGTNPFLTLTPFEKSVCGNEYVETITASLKNTTSSLKNVQIHAEQPILFPTFDDEQISLGAGEFKLIPISLNVSPTNTGTYDGTITASTDQIVVVRPFSVKVNDCPTPIPKTISLDLPKTTKDLTKNQDNSIPLKVKNLTNDPQGVDVFVNSPIFAKPLSATLGPKENATLHLILNPDYSIPAGVYAIQVTAVASGYSITQTMNVRVLPVNFMEWQSITTAYALEKGQTKDVALILHNRGDSTQNVTFNVASAIPGVDFTFTPSAATIEKGKSIAVNLSISVHEDSPVENVNTSIRAVGTSTASIPLAFTVNKPSDVVSTVLEFVSFPQSLAMEKDSKKEVVFSIHNSSDRSISNVHFKLGGVKGASISVVGVQNITIAPLETKTMTLTLVTQEDTPTGAYSPILIAEGTNALGTIPFTLDVKEKGALGLLSGLVTFIGDKASLIGLIILVLLGVVWFTSRTKETNPVWAPKSQ